ncbi:MAG: FHA domain-containing protein [Polyangiaceae bacterium]|nr:FHA domain-containing protein [Polyangiaceae bacterium]
MRLVQAPNDAGALGSIYPIRGRMIVGKRPSEDFARGSATITLKDICLARDHAEITLEEGGIVRLTDLASPNGTLVNRQMVRSVVLRDGDEIRMGTSLFVYRCFLDRRGAPTAAAAPVRIFCGHAPEDGALLSELEGSLAAARRAGLVELWSTRQIKPGEDADAAVRRALDGADLIILLISASFLNSDLCWHAEVLPAMERHARGAVRVIPVIARSCSWKDAPFASLSPLPADGRAIADSPGRDRAWTAVADAVISAAEDVRKNR